MFHLLTELQIKFLFGFIIAKNNSKGKERQRKRKREKERMTELQNHRLR